MKKWNHGSNEAMLGSTTTLVTTVVFAVFSVSSASSRFMGAQPVAAPSPALQAPFALKESLKATVKDMLKEGPQCIGCGEKTIVIPVPAASINHTLPEPPKAGDLVKHVKTQLASDHRTLGKVSEALMAIQTEVGRTEESMLGKVLDLQTARSFFTRHQEIDTANEKLHDDITALNAQVEGLSSNLYKVQKKFLESGHEYKKAEDDLETEIIEDKTLIQSINAELAKEDDLEEALKKLTKIHDGLLDQAVEARNTGEKAMTMLKTARVESQHEAGKHRGLRHQLITMNNYSLECHAKVEKTSKVLGLAMLKESKDNNAAITTMKQKQKANTATGQRLLAERAILVSEIKRYEEEEMEELRRIRELRDDYQKLSDNIVNEVQRLEDQIKEEGQRLKSMQSSLMANTQAAEEDLSKKETLDAQMRELIKQLHDEENPVIIATLEGQNSALQQELNDAYKLWENVTAHETKAVLEKDEANSTRAAEEEGLRTAAEALQTAHKEGDAKVAEAIQHYTEVKKQAAVTIEKAKATIAERCKSKWDDISKDKNKQIEECKVAEEDLLVEKAKSESLKQTLAAKAAVS